MQTFGGPEVLLIFSKQILPLCSEYVLSLFSGRAGNESSPYFVILVPSLCVCVLRPDAKEEVVNGEDIMKDLQELAN